MRYILSVLVRDHRGGTAIEYGLIAALVAIGAFAAIQSFATTSIGIWNNVSNTVSKS